MRGPLCSRERSDNSVVHGKRQIRSLLSAWGDRKKVFTSKALRKYLQSLVANARRFAARRVVALSHTARATR
jgi:hypothetical protein